MTQTLVLDVIREAVLTIIFVALPVLLTSLTVGFVVSLLQAVTQIQEQTLTFVPKLIAVLLSLVLFGNFMMNRLIALFESMLSLISSII